MATWRYEDLGFSGRQDRADAPRGAPDNTRVSSSLVRKPVFKRVSAGVLVNACVRMMAAVKRLADGLHIQILG